LPIVVKDQFHHFTLSGLIGLGEELRMLRVSANLNYQKRILKKYRKRKSQSLCALNGTEKTKSTLKSVKFCPKCGSTNVFWASGLPQLWSIWECRNCRYRGPVILENSKLAEKLRARVKQASK